MLGLKLHFYRQNKEGSFVCVPRPIFIPDQFTVRYKQAASLQRVLIEFASKGRMTKCDNFQTGTFFIRNLVWNSPLKQSYLIIPITLFD